MAVNDGFEKLWK